MKKILREIIIGAVKKEYPEVPCDNLNFSVDTGNNPAHGDFSTNVAMQLTKTLRKKPQEIALKIAGSIDSSLIDRIEVVGPGFTNFFIEQNAFQDWLGKLLDSPSLLKSNVGEGRKVLVEFVSANPTGPLHIGHGRGAAIGDSVAAILEAAGYSVSREYYVNDAGNQMNNLAASICCRYFEQHGKQMDFPQDGYHGEYIGEIAGELSKVYGNKLLDMDRQEALSICKRAGIKTILAQIDGTLKRFNVKIDEYFSEQSVYDNGDIDKTLDKLEKARATYEHDGALWLKTKQMGDDEDRVLRKSDGSYTYLTPDIAYHDNKYRRGFDRLIDVWGADHHGYKKRMECGIELTGNPSASFDVIFVQMVSLLRGGEKVKMSTRGGEFVTLDWLIDEVGVDAARFFYNMRGSGAQFEFDVDLAKTRSNDNPVYYVQYAHARVCSLMAKASGQGIKIETGKYLELLSLPSEKETIKKLMDFPYVIETAAQYNEPHRVVYYLQELAGAFHSYYYDNVIIAVDDENLTNARLSLCKGVACAVKYGLELLGVSAPERM